ncbi:hypothetical protein [Burkholderia pseudomallei]|uniref:hypothetical protein n=1 Tax=Burkholderia pseudomallei TaxID=28450 RepID=UPI00016ABC51|nr:hypothetical protein [Burkholderia pseudomallei]OMS52740.1 hypothetical protein AQ743_07050 [Burkholderia pseudomallei]OMS54285.1 hypothetical protein AQ744_00565 [Burkholderia pseudomallei]OMS73068.1 hypothetical protein AQ745_04255 [Burkholderia pseudomallei]OMS84915.1 hypothetical protein AQ747_01760 [Burkholderia pseudomallei]CAJ2902814.1 Uncharacterised protein [Burkholderia pseudomallei]
MTAGAVAFSLMLGACGGGGGDEASSTASTGTNSSAGTDNVTATDAEVVANVKSSNIDFLPANRPAGTWRWSGTPSQHILVYVPTPTSGNSTEQDYAAKANNSITQINAKLNGLLVLESTAAIPTNSNYIRVSYGTSYVPAGSTNYQNYCANVSTAPSVGNVIQPDSQNGIASNPVYLNLGNGHCDVTQDIVTHEFGHALGLASHFNGFGGDGPSISTAFWDVLATLYSNPQSTPASSLVVKRAAN